MCNHHLLIEVRPDGDNYDTWQDIGRVELGGGLGVPRGGSLDKPLEQAHAIARDYATAYPEQAPHIVIQQYSCNGLEGDLIRPHLTGFDGTPAHEDVQRMAADNLRLREALRFYADRRRWQLAAGTGQPDANGQLTVSFPAAQDAGERARRALRGHTPTPPPVPQPRPPREQAQELSSVVGARIEEVSARNNRTLHLRLDDGRRIRIDADQHSDGKPAFDTGIWGRAKEPTS